MYAGTEPVDGVIRIAVGAPINDLAFAPGGEALATASSDGRVQIWSASGGATPTPSLSWLAHECVPQLAPFRCPAPHLHLTGGLTLAQMQKRGLGCRLPPRGQDPHHRRPAQRRALRVAAERGRRHRARSLAEDQIRTAAQRSDLQPHRSRILGQLPLCGQRQIHHLHGPPPPNATSVPIPSHTSLLRWFAFAKGRGVSPSLFHGAGRGLITSPNSPSPKPFCRSLSSIVALPVRLSSA